MIGIVPDGPPVFDFPPCTGAWVPLADGDLAAGDYGKVVVLRVTAPGATLEARVDGKTLLMLRYPDWKNWECREGKPIA